MVATMENVHGRLTRDRGVFAHLEDRPHRRGERRIRIPLEGAEILVIPSEEGSLMLVLSEAEDLFMHAKIGVKDRTEAEVARLIQGYVLEVRALLLLKAQEKLRVLPDGPVRSPEGDGAEGQGGGGAGVSTGTAGVWAETAVTGLLALAVLLVVGGLAFAAGDKLPDLLAVPGGFAGAVGCVWLAGRASRRWS